MELIYYPDMYITSEELLKGLVLSWGKVSTIVPPSQMEHIDAYLAGEVRSETQYALETYKKIYDIFGSSILDFTVISDDERTRASDKMFDLLTTWNRDTGFYDSLKVNSLSDITGKTIEWYWFLHEKLEQNLVELLLQEKLVINWSPGEIMGYQEVGKSYMSVIADEVKLSRKARLITDDPFFMAAKSGMAVSKNQAQTAEQSYQLVSLAVPQIFLNKATLKKLSWSEIRKIRQDLLPLSEKYYSEIETYQESINSLAVAGKDSEAFDKFCEFCERVAMSFKPFAKETRKLFRLATDPETVGLLNGILLPTIKLMNPNATLSKICDFAAISSTLVHYSVPRNKPVVGFEYLENLSRHLSLKRLQKTISCLVPKVKS